MSNPNQISIEQGQSLITNFHSDPKFADQPNAISFNKNVFNELLNQPDAQALNFYFGKNINGSIALVIIAMDSNKNEISNKIMDIGGKIPPDNVNYSPFIIQNKSE